MANTIIHKKSSVSGKSPLTTDLALGELAVNTYDGIIYLKKFNTIESIVPIKEITKANIESVFTGAITSHTHSYLPLTGGTLTGVLDFNGTTGRVITITNDTTVDSADASIYLGNGTYGFDLLYEGTGFGNENAFSIKSDNSGNPKIGLRITQDGIINFPQTGANVNGNLIWHAGNDGSGSGLDADLLDGQNGSYYLDWVNVTNKPDPVITLGGDCSGSVTLTDLGNGTLTVTVADDSHNHVISNVDGLQTALDGKLSLSGGTMTGQIVSTLATGTSPLAVTSTTVNTNLNADLLDGLHSSSFFRADASNAVDVRLSSGDGRGLKFWDSDSYKIWMSSSGNATYGGRITGETTSDYNIYFRIKNGTNRGFVFENAYATKLFAINGDGVRSQVGIKSNTFRDTIQTLGSISTNTTLNTDNGNVITATIGAALTFTFSGTLTDNGITFMLKLTNGGAYLVTWPSSVKWPGGIAPALTASGTDILVFNTSDGGTTWHGIANLDVR